MNNHLHSILERKQAGVSRMRSRQMRIHFRMAELLENHPEMIRDAQQKALQRIKNSGPATKEIYAEWYRILTTRSVEYIAKLLRGQDDENEQLRACAPFNFAEKELS